MFSYIFMNIGPLFHGIVFIKVTPFNDLIGILL